MIKNRFDSTMDYGIQPFKWQMFGFNLSEYTYGHSCQEQVLNEKQI